jgi:hypothetical protein
MEISQHAAGSILETRPATRPLCVSPCSDARSMTGRFLLDEDVLRNAGLRDFDAYQYAPGEKLTPDLFVAGR